MSSKRQVRTCKSLGREKKTPGAPRPQFPRPAGGRKPDRAPGTIAHPEQVRNDAELIDGLDPVYGEPAEGRKPDRAPGRSTRPAGGAAGAAGEQPREA